MTDLGRGVCQYYGCTRRLYNYFGDKWCRECIDVNKSTDTFDVHLCVDKRHTELERKLEIARKALENISRSQSGGATVYWYQELARAALKEIE